MSRRPSDASPVRERPSPSGDDAGQPAATSANPFPGPRPFAEDEDWLFFGRDRELSDLVALLFAQRTILLHGPSGVGKSSLVYAGLVPRAQRRGFPFLPVARVRDTAAGPPEEVAGNRYVNNVIGNWRELGLDVPRGVTFAEALNALPPPEEPGRVVVFDQFEEIFVVHPERWKDRADLLLQVQAALDRDPLLHVVFVLRDDFLARLQPLTPLFRDRLSTRYHLRGLSSRQALDAVVSPFAATGRTFAAGVAEDLVRALRAQPAVPPETQTYEGEDVEPVQLQIVCRTFFDGLPPDVVEIGASDVERYADVGQALVGFYEHAVAAAVKGHPRARERKVRLWFERQLITPAHSRGIVFRDERATAGLPNEVVDELEQRRVVRSEPRGPAIWYELPHDRLIDAVLSSNRVWYARRSRTIARLWAAVGVLGVLSAVVSLAALTWGGDGEEASDPEHHEITSPGDTVRRTVAAHAGQQLTAVMTPSGFTGELRLRDSQGAVIAQSTGIAASSSVLVTTPIPADGEYQVEARAQGRDTGTFHLAFAAQTPDGQGRQLNAGEPVPGRIGGRDEVDVYAFAGRPGSVAQVSMSSEGSLNATLVVTGPYSPAVVRRRQGQAVVAFTVPQESTYEVRASFLGEQTGNYRLDLELSDAEPAPGRVSGSLDGRNPVDVWPVRSEAGGVLQVGYAPGAASTLTLFAGDGRDLIETYVGADEGERGFDRPWVIAPGVTYLLMAEWKGDPTPYSLSIEADDARPLRDRRAQGELSLQRPLAVYRFDGHPGDVSVLVAPEEGLDVFVGIVQPGGTDLIPVMDEQGAGVDENFTVPLRQAGPHLVAVGSKSSEAATGRFDVVVTEGG